LSGAIQILFGNKAFTFFDEMELVFIRVITKKQGQENPPLKGSTGN
jgi:hypothetical protein